MNRHIVLALALCLGCSSEVIEPGYVGFMVRSTGDRRGVDPTPLYGRIWEGIGEEVYSFPTSLQNTVWEEHGRDRENNPVNESLSFSLSGGVSVNIDVGMTFRVDPAKAGTLYTRYHQTDLSVLADGEIRNLVRDGIQQNAASMSVDDILGDGRNRLLAVTLTRVRNQLSPHGIIVENLTFTSGPRLPANVQTAINASLEAQQRQAQAEARARGEVAAADGRARAQRAYAQGDADALLIRTRADLENRRLMAQAYRDLGASLSPGVLQYLYLQRWNGALASTCGGSTGLAQVVRTTSP